MGMQPQVRALGQACPECVGVGVADTRPFAVPGWFAFFV